MTAERTRRERLRQLLLEKSYRKGEVVLASGRVSDFYVDCKQTALHPEGAFLLGQLFLEMIIEENIGAVAGVTLGGDPLVTAVSLAALRICRSLPALIVRKQAKGHGTDQGIEGMVNVEKGAKVVLLEDVVTSGGSSLRAYKALEKVGLKIAVICVIIDRQEGGKEHIENAGYELRSIFTRESLLGVDKQLMEAGA